MQYTRRGWELAAIGGILVVVAVLARQPVALYAAVGVASYGIGHQFLAVRSVQATDNALTITYTTARRQVSVDEPVQLTMIAELEQAQSTTVTVSVPLPVAAEADAEPTTRRVSIEPGEQSASTSVVCSFPIAGRFIVPPPEVRITDRTGRFRETLPRGDRPTVIVTPHSPDDIHVGQGGDSVAAYGTHPSGKRGAGLMPAELRQYVPGDIQRRIDWKATARLGEPHVREFKSETDRQTVLVVDARASMCLGQTGRRMLDYTREVALGVVDVAERYTDPIGCYVVDDGGVTGTTTATSTQAYRRVRTTLYDLPTAGATAVESGGTPTPGGVSSPRDSVRNARMLAGDDSAFAQTIKPFFDARRQPPTTAAGVDRPLVAAIERLHVEQTSVGWTVLLTSDADRREVREAVRTASRNDGQLFVFLTPRVLFDTDGLADVASAYERYVEFEQFRRELDRHEGVTAFEVAPGDRLHAVLAQQRRGFTPQS